MTVDLKEELVDGWMRVGWEEELADGWIRGRVI
jgi:hypothetical protein